jgi:uncharacterized membrane protein
MSTELRSKFKNLLSRKFITAIIPIIMGIVAYFVSDEAMVKIVGMSISALVGIVFNVVEGKLDSASIKASVDAVLDILEQLGVVKDTDDTRAEEISATAIENK